MIVPFSFSLYVYLILQAGPSYSTGESDIKENEVDVEKFDYIRKEPGNEFGIYSKIIAQVFRPANQTTEEYRINREFLPEDARLAIVESCENGDGKPGLKWSGCKTDEEGFFVHVSWGTPEPKNKTITYLELNFKAFTKQSDNEEEEICLLEEVYRTKAYIVMNTFSEVPSNDSFPRNFVDSVDTVHQHQLDAFGENFLSLFGDRIDADDIYNFGKDEYYDRDPPYECFLAIGSSASKAVLEEKCDFFCLKKAQHSKEEIEKILAQAKRVADEEEQSESDTEDEEEVEKLFSKNRVEL